MGTRVSFTPLYGAAGRPPLASLLTIRGFTFLLDCGWDDSYDTALLAPLEPALPRIDAVLLSHADMAHMGALPYLVRKGLQAGTLLSAHTILRYYVQALTYYAAICEWSPLKADLDEATQCCLEIRLTSEGAIKPQLGSRHTAT